MAQLLLRKTPKDYYPGFRPAFTRASPNRPTHLIIRCIQCALSGGELAKGRPWRSLPQSNGSSENACPENVFQPPLFCAPFWLGCLFLVFCWNIDTATAIDAVIVRPSSWQESVQPWKEHRATNGIRILELDSELGREAIQAKIRSLHAQHASFRFVALAGDVGPNPTTHIGTFYRKSTALVQFGGDPTLATDVPYVDIDQDDVPDLSLGRIPADSADELARYFQRVIAYERNPDFESWRRDVHVVAGVGGFGAVTDSIIELTTRQFLADRIPGWSHVSMTQASLNSHYCPDPFRFSETCINRMNQGGMFWVYIGHGHVRTLDYVRVEKDLLPILTHEQLPAIDSKTRPPIAIFLACYTGAFDAKEDSLAEELILGDHGPIAAIAASRVSGPYGLATLSNGLLDSFYVDQRATLGEVHLSAKRKMQTTDASNSNPTNKTQQMQLIAGLATALSPNGYDLGAERKEHVWQMHLLGDPMLRLRHPSDLQLQLPTRAQPGSRLEIVGTSQASGRVTVELCTRRGQVSRESKASADYQTAAGREAMQTRYERANQPTLVSTTFECSAGQFVTSLEIPKDISKGKYAVRAFQSNIAGWQVGYGEVSIRPPRN